MKPVVKYDPEIALRGVVTGAVLGWLLGRLGKMDEQTSAMVGSLVYFAYDYAAVSIKTWIAKRKANDLPPEA